MSGVLVVIERSNPVVQVGTSTSPGELTIPDTLWGTFKPTLTPRFNRCEILLTKLKMDHSDESRTIRELQGALDKRVAEWDADVASENRVTWMILVPFFGIPLLIGIVACCGGALKGVF
jgi:hypothetical protein